MAQRAVVLGGGMVGSVMAADLLAGGGFEVSLADRRPEALERARRRAGDGLRTIQADLSDPFRVRKLAEDHDLVLGALSSHLGFAALGAIVDTGRPYADISFMSEDARQWHDRARRTGTRAIVDCGVAPGMSNLLVGHAAAHLSRIDRVEILVGGLPVQRTRPFEYKAGFAPADVIEEYTRPVRVVQGGRRVEKVALSEVEHVEFEGVGTLEAFLTDGLRSLADTIDCPEMVEKTLRYPGHADLMRAFRTAGLFSKEKVQVGDAKISPLEVTSHMLFPCWSYEEGEEDLTVMRVTVDGKAHGHETRYRWSLVDRYCQATRSTSMSRSTGLTCTAAARMLADGSFDEPGVHPPEVLGAHEDLVTRMLDELAQRGITYCADLG